MYRLEKRHIPVEQKMSFIISSTGQIRKQAEIIFTSKYHHECMA